VYYGKKTISKTELEKLFAVSSEKELFEIISTLSEQKILTPIKNAKTNGNRVYPIYLKYKVLVPLDTYDAELEEIKVLHPMLLNNGYLQAKPEEYKKYRNLIQRLDRYLFSCRVDDVSISRKERSFEIFDEEKVLDDKTFCCLLERIGITSSILGFYDTPEYCFNDFIPKKTDHMTLLICENKDIWFASNGEIYDYVQAYNRLVFSLDGERVYNPSCIPVFIELRGRVYEIPCGKEISFDK